MRDEALGAILGLDGEERYDFFLSQVAAERAVWILVNADNRFLKISSDVDGVEYLPVWPAADFAVDYAAGTDELTPLSISLPEFFQRWVPGLTRDGLEVGVLPGLDKTL